MSSPDRYTSAFSRSRSRRSIAHMPSPDMNPGNDKENMTADISVMSSLKRPAQQDEKTRKSRSKSIGPGGLDALQDGTGNRRKPAIAPTVKSILKPSIPLSPPKAIPSFVATRKKSPGKSKLNTVSTQKNVTQGLLVDLSVPSEPAAPVTGTHNLANPFDGPGNAMSPMSTKVAVRTEEEQQTAARERAEKEERDRERQEILDHRSARRKSMANRRVSFAPEATLHTWNVELITEDSTTSSASTNSTRRVSSMTAALPNSPFPQPTSPMPGSDTSGPPSTPPEQVEEPVVKASPAHQRDLHQKRRRRQSSGIPPMSFNNLGDVEALSSSPYSGSSPAESEDASGQTVIPDNRDDDSDGDGESTALSMEIQGDVTGQSVVSTRSEGSSTSSGARLDEALRQASQEAGTRGIEYDENGDISMELADQEVTGAFQLWANKGVFIPKAMRDPRSLQDQENMNPFSPAFKASTRPTNHQSPTGQEDENEDRSMDVTRAVGGILPPQQTVKTSPGRGRRKSVAPSRRRSSVNRRRSSGDSSTLEDETMDLTADIGGIAQERPLSHEGEENNSAIEEDEELTMEFTTVVGGVVHQIQGQREKRRSLPGGNQQANRPIHEQRRESLDSVSMEDDMDITGAVGGILPPIEERTEPVEDQTMEMNITTSMGMIVPQQLSTGNKSRAKALMEMEADAGQLTSSPFQAQTGPSSPPKSAVSQHLATVASETGSPSLATINARSGRKSVGSRLSTTPKTNSRQATPNKQPSTPSEQPTPKQVSKPSIPSKQLTPKPAKPVTPSKQLTPLPPKPTTPGKTPPMNNVTFRSASPKKLFKAEIKAGSAKKSPVSQKIFQQDLKTDESTPSVVLKPHRRRSSGLGIDKESLGSPRVAALLDRRGSIGDVAQSFKPQDQPSRLIRFDDPRVLEREVDEEREEEERRESGRVVLEKEADQQEEKDATINLKEMIQSLTPKKNKLKGRKSLHVGAAKGLLGKRPIELDEEDNESDESPKRLKGRQASPVKNVKLPAPPSKAETVGGIRRSGRHTLAETAGNAQKATPTTTVSPAKGGVTTPKNQGRFKDAEAHSSAAKPTPFEDKLDAADEVERIDPEEQEDERIHLQDFLNMTNIHFMELTTTKRRHTVAPSSAKKVSAQQSSPGNDGATATLEDCVVAGVCTVPMLELYQHSCRELKSYISEGRRIIRSIEAETFAENPPLFREYLSATPEIRLLMDNQFRNVKTHARLLSKAMWYGWRMKLLEGLKEGLERHIDDMAADDEMLKQQEELLHTALPGLMERLESLTVEAQRLAQQVEELESSDPEELRDARAKFLGLDVGIEEKEQMLERLEGEMQSKGEMIEAAAELKTEYLEQIHEAERVGEECRGWSGKEVNALKASSAILEKSTGWSIASASDEALTMVYRGALRVVLSLPGEDNNDNETRVLSLTSTQTSQHEPSTEKRFVLQIMQSYVHATTANSPRGLLSFISKGWDLAESISEEIRMLSIVGLTRVSIRADDVLQARNTILISGEKRGRIDVVFTVKAGVGNGNGNGSEGLDVDVDVGLEVVYGDFHAGDLQSKHVKKILREGRGVGGGGRRWRKAVEALERCLAV